MISRVTGKVVEKGLNYLVLDLGNFCYDILIPTCVMQRIDESISSENKISLITYHYYQTDQAKSIPMLIGFLNQVEKDFFEIFITVSGIGPRAALKALNKPISLIAKAIDEADLNFLAVRAMGWPAHTGGPGPWIRLKGQDYWEALSANYVSRFGRRFVLPESWNLWFI